MCSMYVSNLFFKAIAAYSSRINYGNYPQKGEENAKSTMYRQRAV